MKLGHDDLYREVHDQSAPEGTPSTVVTGTGGARGSQEPAETASQTEKAALEMVDEIYSMWYPHDKNDGIQPIDVPVIEVDDKETQGQETSVGLTTCSLCQTEYLSSLLFCTACRTPNLNKHGTAKDPI